MKIGKIKKEYILLQAYILPFYFLIYMMFFRDPIGNNFWKESEFNKTVQNRSLFEIQEMFGEPDNFKIRDNMIILDYNDLVYPKEKAIRYQFVRLIFFKTRAATLLPQNIYYKK